MKLTPNRYSLLLATKNPRKFQEILELIGPDYIIQSMATLSDTPDIEEIGDSFEINARLKAEGISRYFPGWVLAEDSGLEVDALHGTPGVYSARYAGARATSAENRALLLKRLEIVPEGQRTARLCCVLALARCGKTLLTSFGTVQGAITMEERGNGGFGYDALFLPLGYKKTFAELPASVKNKISHRSSAFMDLRHHLAILMKNDDQHRFPDNGA